MGLKYNWGTAGKRASQRKYDDMMVDFFDVPVPATTDKQPFSSEQRTERIPGRGPARWYRTRVAKVQPHSFPSAICNLTTRSCASSAPLRSPVLD
jgi:hypothetical protein